MAMVGTERTKTLPMLVPRRLVAVDLHDRHSKAFEQKGTRGN